MMLNNEVITVIKVTLLCAVWYSVGSAYQIHNKILLRKFPFPLTLTIIQYFSIFLYNKPFVWIKDCQIKLSWPYYFKFVIPLALGMFANTYLTIFSTLLVSVSYTQTVKATSPLFTVFITRLCMNERQTIWIYLSLVPIVCGAIIATLTELEFDSVGMILALCSTLGFCMQGIFSKKVLRDTGMHNLVLLEKPCIVILICSIPFWLLFDLRGIIALPISTDDSDSSPVKLAIDLFCNGVLYWLHCTLIFGIIDLVSPLSYSIIGSVKRIVIICFSLIILRNPITWFNAFGMTLACVGVLIYNLINFYQKKNNSNLPLVNQYNINNSVTKDQEQK